MTVIKRVVTIARMMTLSTRCLSAKDSVTACSSCVREAYLVSHLLEAGTLIGHLRLSLAASIKRRVVIRVKTESSYNTPTSVVVS